MDMMMDCPLLVNKMMLQSLSFLTALWVMITTLLTDNFLQVFWDIKLPRNVSNKLQINTTSYNKSVR